MGLAAVNAVANLKIGPARGSGDECRLACTRDANHGDEDFAFLALFLR